MARTFPLTACLCALACASTLSAQPAHDDGAARRTVMASRRPPERTAQPSEALIALLRESLTSPASRNRQDVMRSLAALRDPALRPLFVQLVEAPEPDVRMQAILAAAQIDESRGIDLLAVQRLQSRAEQATVVAEAVGRDLLAPGQLEDVARWKDLDDRLSVSIAGLLTAQGRPPAPQRVRAILDDASHGPELRLHAALVLMQQGQSTVEPQALTLTDELLALPGARSDDALAGIMARVRLQRLSASLPILERIRTRSADRPLRVFETLQTMLIVAPDHPGVLAAAASDLGYGAENGRERAGDRVRIALAMLEAATESSARITPALGALLESDNDPFIACVRAVLLALPKVEAHKPTPLAEPVCALVRLRYPKATEWALRFARQRPHDEALAIRLAVVEQAAHARTSAALSLAASAATDVCDDDPALLRPAIAAAISADDRPLLFALLTGCLRSTNAGVVALLSPEAGKGEVTITWPDAACAALADLALARHAAHGSMNAERCERIERIALGEGELPTVYRLQAAWLALKGRGQDRVALARLLADAAPPADPGAPPPRGTP